MPRHPTPFSSAFLIIFFIIYSLIIFQISSPLFFIFLIIFHLFYLFFLPLNFYQIRSQTLHFLPFLLLTTLLNFLFTNQLSFSLLVGLRLFLVFNLSLLLSSVLTPLNLTNGFIYLLQPLKFFHINPKNIALFFTITLAAIPLIFSELHAIKHTLLAKNFAFNLKNAFTRPQIFLISYFNSLWLKIDLLERSLKAKAYE